MHTYTTSMLLVPINIPRSVVQLAKGPKQKPAAIKWSHDWKFDVTGNRSGVKLLPSLLLTMPYNVTMREQYTNICHNYAVNRSDRWLLESNRAFGPGGGGAWIHDRNENLWWSHMQIFNSAPYAHLSMLLSPQVYRANALLFCRVYSSLSTR